MRGVITFQSPRAGGPKPSPLSTLHRPERTNPTRPRKPYRKFIFAYEIRTAGGSLNRCYAALSRIATVSSGRPSRCVLAPLDDRTASAPEAGRDVRTASASSAARSRYRRHETVDHDSSTTGPMMLSQSTDDTPASVGSTAHLSSRVNDPRYIGGHAGACDGSLTPRRPRANRHNGAHARWADRRIENSKRAYRRCP